MSVRRRAPGWVRALYVIVGILLVIFGFVCMFRPLVTLEFVLILVPLALLINDISWIVLGAAAK